MTWHTGSMISRRWITSAVAFPVATVLVVGGCSSDRASTSTTTTPVTVTVAATTTTVAATTTPPTVPPTVAPTSTTSSTTTSTSTSTTSTTTTVAAPGRVLVIGDDGLGEAKFGADPDQVVAYITSILGAPTTDSGWTDPSAFGVCPGTETRQVVWGDLQVLFGDASTGATGRRHFFSYTYGQAFGTTINPFGLATDAGIRIGSTVAELKGTYPTVQLFDADVFVGPNFVVRPGLTGLVSDTTDTGLVTQLAGGIGCGE